MPGRPIRHTPTLFSLRLRRARMNATLGGEKVRQTDLARLLGVSPTTVRRWETGRRLPAAANMARIAVVLGMSEDEVWLDTWHLPADILTFLVTTREGLQTVKNIRRIMTQLDEGQKPTTRRGVPDDIHLNYNDPIYRDDPNWPYPPGAKAANERRRRKKLGG